MRPFIKYLHILYLLVFSFSCKKFVEIDPPKTGLTSLVVFSNENTARAAMSDIYSYMILNGLASGDINSGINFIGGVSADEFENFDLSNKQEFYMSDVSAANMAALPGLWNVPYRLIYSCNSVLEGIAQSETLSTDVKIQFEGEAKFVRAFCYFYLVNLFGDVPLHLTTDYRINSTAVRSASTLVYDQIVADLKDAEVLLKEDYSVSGNQRVIPNRWAASALLARTYLYTKDWANAEVKASEIIQDSDNLFFLESDINSIFLKDSHEAIWQLIPPYTGDFNTLEGYYFILTANPINSVFVSLSDELLNKFELGDLRKSDWIGSYSDGPGIWYYPFKYKVGISSTLSEYLIVFRLAEQYLIRSEARANQNKLSEAIQDLDSIRNRAQLPLIANTNPVISKDNLLLAIEQERFVELFSEWGHRWLDLKRTGRCAAILEPLKDGNWQSTDELYPIPQIEINSNRNIEQNEAY